MLTQLPRVPSLIPSSFATRAIGREVSITIFTASSLNSGEKLFFGRGNYFTFPDVHPNGWTVRKPRGTPQVTDVDQVDAGLDQVHRPAAPEGMRRDRQSGGPAGVAGPDGPHVAGQDFGHPGPGQPGVVRSVEQRVRVGAEAGVRVTVFQVAGDEPCGLVHHGHVSD